MKEILRRKAEEFAKTNMPPTGKQMTSEEMRQALHELRLHQIELEMQNEELRRAQTELEAVRAKYFDLYDMAPIGYVTLNEQGQLLEFNATFTTMLGVSENEFHNLPFNRLVFHEDQDTYNRFRKQLVASGERIGCELRLNNPGLNPLWVKIEASRAYENENAPVYRMVIIDISDRKHVEELRAQIDGAIFHDLRSPACNAVNVASLLLEADGLTKVHRKLLELLRNTGKQMLDTLECSQDIYKIETGQYKVESTVIDCLPVVREISQNLHSMPQFEDIPLHIAMDGAPPASDASFPCLGQIKLLRASLYNLTQSALEASPPGEPVVVELLSIQGGRIEIRNRSVAPRAIRERYFEKYATSGKPPGTWLGAYSAKMMIEALGGTLEMLVADHANETVLRIDLPV